MRVRVCKLQSNIFPRWWQFRQRYRWWKLKQDAKQVEELIVPEMRQYLAEEVESRILYGDKSKDL